MRYSFTGVPETDPRACFNRATWNPAVNLQQPPLGTSHLILGDSLVRVLSSLRTSWSGHGSGHRNEGESQEEEEDDDEQVDFGSQVSLNSSTQENEAHVEIETGTMDKFGVVRTIRKDAITPGQSRGFAIIANSVPRTGEIRNKGLGNALAAPEVDNEKTSRHRVKARISTSTKLPGTDRVTPPIVTPLVDNEAALEEDLNNIVGSIGEQKEQMSIRTSELERAVHIEKESLREEINSNRQEVGRSEERLKERTDEHIAKNLSRMTREAEQRELRLRDDMEKLRTQQEQTLGTLDTKLEVMMQRQTQAIMDRLDGLLGSRSGPSSGGPSREPKVNFNDHQRRRADGSTRSRSSSSGYTTRDYRTWGPNSRASSTGNRQTSNERPTKAHMQLGEVISVTGELPAQGRFKWAKEEIVPVIRIVGMHQIENHKKGVTILRQDTQGMLRQWPQPSNP